MWCGRVSLFERDGARGGGSGGERPRRCCQRRMVDPTLDEEPLHRFRCDNKEEPSSPHILSESVQSEIHDANDLVLTVLNIRFPGNMPTSKTTRSCFKYKMPLPDSNRTHRMFVKQLVENDESYYDDGCSQSDCKIEDYVENILEEKESSRPPTSLSGLILHSPIVQHQPIESKPETNQPTKTTDDEATRKISATNENPSVQAECLNDIKTSVKYRNTGKRRSLTISRAPSPETVQVIRVDVMCNYSGRSSVVSESNLSSEIPELPAVSAGNPDFARCPAKFFLTNASRQLDQHIGGGEKVTLMCKTFKLSARPFKARNKIEEVNNNSINPATKIEKKNN